MQRRAAFSLSALVGLGLVVACGDGSSVGADDDGAPSGTVGASSGGAVGASSSGGGTSSGSSGASSGGRSSSSGSSSGEQPDGSTDPVRPDECVVLETGAFYNGPDLNPRQYGAQPTFRGLVVVPDGLAAPDLLHIRIDASTGVGSYDLAPAAGESNGYQHGLQTVYLQQDINGGISGALYVAVAGTLRVDAQITADQSQGELSFVELREASLGVRNLPYNAASLVAGGRCLWIQRGAFDTRRTKGCNPLVANACPAAQACIRENAAGSDGTCQASTGGGTNSAPCSRTANGDSNCGLEFMCSEDPPDSRKCRKLCNLYDGGNACPTGTFCGFFGYCEPPTSQLDPAAIGESCSPSKSFCGSDDARGMCFNAMSEQNTQLPEGTRCHAIERSRAACPAGQELGYVTFEGYADRSAAACVPSNE